LRGLLVSRPRLRRLLFVSLASLHRFPLCSHFRSLGNDVAPGLETIDVFLVLKPQSIELVGTWGVRKEINSGSARLLLTWEGIDIGNHLALSISTVIKSRAYVIGFASRSCSLPPVRS
jgi:hypothetical protein